MAPVTLNIYDVSSQGMVKMLNDQIKSMGTGAFHGGLEVFGKEWSFGYTEKGTGIFQSKPKGCDLHQFRESVKIGDTKVTEKEFEGIIAKMKGEWPGVEYDLLRKNCCVFCYELSKELGVESGFPQWTLHLAAAGATVCDGAVQAANAAQAAAIMAAAKANEFDKKYDIVGTTQAKAADVMLAWESADHKYKIRETGMQLLDQAKSKATELDQKYNIAATAMQAVSALEKGAKDASAKIEDKAVQVKKEGGCPIC